MTNQTLEKICKPAIDFFTGEKYRIQRNYVADYIASACRGAAIGVGVVLLDNFVRELNGYEIGGWIQGALDVQIIWGLNMLQNRYFNNFDKNIVNYTQGQQANIGLHSFVFAGFAALATVHVVY